MARLKQYSPYVTGTDIKFDDGTMEREMGPFDLRKDKGDKFITLTSGDRLDSKAQVEFAIVPDAGKYWWVVAMANDIDNGLDPAEYVGRELRFPEISAFKLRN